MELSVLKSHSTLDFQKFIMPHSKDKPPQRNPTKNLSCVFFQNSNTVTYTIKKFCDQITFKNATWFAILRRPQNVTSSETVVLKNPA